MTGEDVFNLIKQLIEKGHTSQEIVDLLYRALGQEYGDGASEDE